MKYLKCMIFVVITILITVNSNAAEIYFKNGDRVTGEIVFETDQSVTIKTEALGEISINNSFIDRFEGRKETAAVPEPEPESLWTRKVSAGYSQAGGNTKTSQGTLQLSANRKTNRDEWIIKGNTYYSSANEKMDAKKFSGMLRYAFSFGNDLEWYNFCKVEGEQDRFANIDYRAIPSVGFGYWFSDTEEWKAMAELALGLEHTNFRDNTKSTNDAILVPRAFLEKKIMDDITVFQDIVMYPSLGDFGEYRLHSETAFINPINERLSLKISFIDDFNSDPTGSSEKNDYRLISAIDYAF